MTSDAPPVVPPVHPPSAVSRGRALLAWAIFVAFLTVLTSSVVAGDLLADRLPPGTTGVEGGLAYLWYASWIGFPAVGAIIASRRRTVLGWLLLGMGLSIALAIGASGLFIYEGAVRGVTPHGLLIWLVSVAAAPAFGLAPFAIDRFPEDLPATGRWRHVVRLAQLDFGVLVVALAVRPTVRDGELAFPNPVGLPALEGPIDAVVSGAAIVLSAFFVLVVGRAIVRFRRATGVARAQLKWFVSALAVFPVMFSVVFLGSSTLPLRVIDAIVAIAFFVSLNGMAAAIGVAILRYRLFEIDRLLSRTVTYVVVSAILVGVYVGGVLMLGALARAAAGGANDLVVALSTLLVAAAFQPVRRRVQTVVDRRFNRARYDAMRTTESFGQRLRDEVDLGELRGDLAVTVRHAVAPASISLWLPGEVAP